MRPSEFVASLDDLIQEKLASLGEVRDAGPAACSDPQAEVVRRLKLALKNELEASELAALWMPSTPELDVKLGLARQSGDEAKHYRLIEEHIETLGVDLDGYDPSQLPPSPMFERLRMFESTVERVAAAQLARESLALVKNEQFIQFCVGVGSQPTAEFYRTAIQPDEQWHVRLGRTTLERYALDDRLQQQAREAVQVVLDLAEKIQHKQVFEMEIPHAPGC